MIQIKVHFLYAFHCPKSLQVFRETREMHTITMYSMAGEKCKSLHFYHVFGSVIYLSQCKLTQAMPFELLGLE